MLGDFGVLEGGSGGYGTIVGTFWSGVYVIYVKTFLNSGREVEAEQSMGR